MGYKFNPFTGSLDYYEPPYDTVKEAPRTLTEEDIENQHIDLEAKIVPKSLNFSVARVMLYEDIDYTCETVSVSGVEITRVNLLGATGVSGAEALTAGDIVFISYLK